MHKKSYRSKSLLDEQFYELLYLAQDEALDHRKKQIFNDRFGINIKNESQTLAQIGERFNLSRERIRQILQQCLRKLRYQATKQIQNKQLNNASAQLVIYLKEIVQPTESGELSRLIDQGIQENSVAYQKPHILNLIIDLIYTEEKAREYNRIVKANVQSLIQQLERQKNIIKPNGIEKLLKRILWPPSIRVVSSEIYSDLAPKRKVSDYSSHKYNAKSGRYFSPKNNRIIQYESEMERFFLEKLEECPSVVRYQDQPFRVPYGTGKYYYPDIFVVLKDGNGFVVEIKSTIEMGLHINLEKWRGLWMFCKDEGFGMLITNGYKEIMQIKSLPVNENFQTAVLDFLSKGPVTWQKYKKLKNIFKPTFDEFTALILINKLEWSVNPFLLKLPNAFENQHTIQELKDTDNFKQQETKLPINEKTQENLILWGYQEGVLAHEDAIKHGLHDEYGVFRYGDTIDNIEEDIVSTDDIKIVYENEIEELIDDDYFSDADDYSRSEEDGWFYRDDDKEDEEDNYT